MPNGKHQIEYLITEATERVAVEGVKADTTDIMLAAFGYLAHKLNEPKGGGVGKKWLAGGVAGGAAVGGTVTEFIKNIFSGG